MKTHGAGPARRTRVRGRVARRRAAWGADRGGIYRAYTVIIPVTAVMLTFWPLVGIETGSHVQINNVCSTSNPFASISSCAVRHLVLTSWATGTTETVSPLSFARQILPKISFFQSSRYMFSSKR